MEAGDVPRFKWLFHYARDGRGAVAEATDKDGRHISTSRPLPHNKLTWLSMTCLPCPLSPSSVRDGRPAPPPLDRA